ncbi:MAG: four helix bundle protein [Candidatus Omnitrophica bacterium]|nr:four helix bundle protein [Candidatus Omnitrophota bacterium]
MRGSEFDFEKLEVWKKAVAFAGEIIQLVANLDTDTKHYRLISQVEASAVSVAANIAEGKGRYSKKEFVQYLYIARGSLYETVTFLTIFNNNGWVKNDIFNALRDKTVEIAKMISGLINSLSKSI